MKFLATALSLSAAIKIKQNLDVPPPSDAVSTDASLPGGYGTTGPLPSDEFIPDASLMPPVAGGYGTTGPLPSDAFFPDATLPGGYDTTGPPPSDVVASEEFFPDATLTGPASYGMPLDVPPPASLEAAE